MSPMAAHLFEPVDIDTGSIEILTEDLFAFQVLLSGSPDGLWRRAFDQVWKESRYPGKLDAVVLEHSIRFICQQSQAIDRYLYLIESRIQAANARIKAYWESHGIPAKPLDYKSQPPTFIPIGRIR